MHINHYTTTGLAQCAILTAAALLVACGGGGGASSSASGAASFTVSGTVAGLAAGQQVTVLNNAKDAQTVVTNSSFHFDAPVAQNASYAVTIGTQPTHQTCTVSNATGAGMVANVNNVVVSCSDNAYSISGSVSGLTSGQVTLLNSGADPQTVAANGNFNFDVPVANGGGYAVTIASQPANQTCTVNNGTGGNVTANVSHIAVVCSATTYTISGTVTGLLQGQQVTLSNNSADPTTVNANGGFSFATPVATGGNYAVSVGTEPVVQNCAVTDGSGNAVSANITNVSITCSSPALTTLYSFSFNDGFNSQSGLVQGSDGNLYGTNMFGGANNVGTLFSYNVATSTHNAVYSFTTSAGNNPSVAPVSASDGKLYGTTSQGSTNNAGSLFVFNPATSSYSELYQFDSAGLANSEAPLIQGSDGNLYGTTAEGGTNGAGAIFQFNPNTSALTVLHPFSGAGTDGATPYSALTQGTDGNYYGTTYVGGVNNLGTIFIYRSATSTFTTLHSFSSSEGNMPYAGLTQGADGKFYGTTTAGGANQLGTVFAFNPGTGSVTTLHSLAVTEGVDSINKLLLANDGNFYGVTSFEGPQGRGTAFMYSPSTGNFAVIEVFSAAVGASPVGALMQGSDGYLYGTTTARGGANGFGTIFRF